MKSLSERSSCSSCRCRVFFVGWVHAFLSYSTRSSKDVLPLGCHVLALDLTASYSFERPELPKRRRNSSFPNDPKPSQDITLPPITRPFGHMRRRSSMVIDMDIPSVPSTEPTSPIRNAFPTTTIPEEPLKSPEAPPVEVGETERQKGLGSLLKSAKQDVTAPEFDMNAFF